MFLTQDEVLLHGVKCEMFNFVDLCSGLGIVWSTRTRTRVSDATAVIFSVKCCNPLKLYPLLSGLLYTFFYLFTSIY